MLFLAELNQIVTWATDIWNANLEVETSEQVYIIAGPEFNKREGPTLVIFKKSYGLCSSGARWHNKFLTHCGTWDSHPPIMNQISG